MNKRETAKATRMLGGMTYGIVIAACVHRKIWIAATWLAWWGFVLLMDQLIVAVYDAREDKQ